MMLPGPQLQVRDALATKVSKERIGTELQGMIDGESCILLCTTHQLHTFCA
jgi:hypothetical protein